MQPQCTFMIIIPVADQRHPMLQLPQPQPSRGLPFTPAMMLHAMRTPCAPAQTPSSSVRGPRSGLYAALTAILQHQTWLTADDLKGRASTRLAADQSSSSHLILHIRAPSRPTCQPTFMGNDTNDNLYAYYGTYHAFNLQQSTGIPAQVIYKVPP